jgi:cytochrome P450
VAVSDTTASVAAAPSGNGIINLLRFGPDPLEFLTRLAHGSDLGVVPVRIGNVTLQLVTDPALVKRTLELDDPPVLGRGRFTRVAQWYRDEGIFVITSGVEHERQRDTLGRPIWNDPRTLEIARRRAAETVAVWREGEPLDVWRAFRRLHFETDWEHLTGEQADEPLLLAFETGDAWQPRLIQPFGTLLWRLPTGRGGRKASALIDERVDALVEQRRRAPAETALDQLSRLVRQAAADGVTTDDQLRATVKLQFPDPLHDFLTWVFWALARNPAVEERWLEEIDRELAGAPATLADVDRLPYAHRVLLETMRLYPPSFGIFREVLQDIDLEGHAIPAGDVVVMSQWVTHRDPRLWDDPLRFDPDRWAEGVPRPPGLTYFPFSAGPHACHGSQQALRETTIVAATVSQRWRLRAESDREPAFALGIGLQPKRPLRLVPVARTS